MAKTLKEILNEFDNSGAKKFKAPGNGNKPPKAPRKKGGGDGSGPHPVKNVLGDVVGYVRQSSYSRRKTGEKYWEASHVHSEMGADMIDSKKEAIDLVKSMHREHVHHLGTKFNDKTGHWESGHPTGKHPDYGKFAEDK